MGARAAHALGRLSAAIIEMGFTLLPSRIAHQRILAMVAPSLEELGA
jgi:hypothetical protein